MVTLAPPTTLPYPTSSAGLPPELARLPNWVTWRWVYDPGKTKPWTKPLLNPRTGGLASSTDPSTWATFTQAVERARRDRLDGVGIVLTPDMEIIGLDLDGCRDPATEVLAEWAADVVRRFPTLWQISPSGTGLRGFLKGRLPDALLSGDRQGRRSGPIEVYQGGRYLTVTDVRHPDSAAGITACPDALVAWLAEVFPPKPAAAPRAPVTLTVADDELLRRCRECRTSGAKFDRLWRGDLSDHGGDHSAGDLALCNLLRFYGGDRAQVERLWGRSGLGKRDKYDRTDYRDWTLDKAMDGERWTPPSPIDLGRERTNGAAVADPAEVAAAAPAISLEEVVAVFQKWLHLPDTSAVKAVLAAVVANLLPGDPAWLMLIGGSGWGKTELLQSLRGLRYAHVAATVTEPALLSGTSKRERDANAKGGLLREIGDFGLLVLKDFTSILSMHREARGQVLAALREIYDGDWTRYVGIDGGKSLSWQGKLGVVAGCTPTIDSHHAVIGAMGERFVSFRLRAEEDEALAKQAVAHAGHEPAMRRELSRAVANLFAGLTIPEVFPAVDEAAQGRIIDLAVLVCRCRSAVERDSHTREIELIPDREAPSRLALVLTRLFVGLRLLGVPAAQAWPVLRRIGMDSMPALRRQVFEQLVGRGAPVTTTDVATAVRYPTQTTRRALEDLAAHQVVQRIPGGEGKADQWELTAFAAGLYVKLEQSFPEMSEGDER